MTSRARLVVGCLLASVLLAPSSFATSSSPRDVAFVTIVGHGSVRSRPAGIACPSTCRAVFVRNTRLRLLAHAADGWRFAGFRSRWCGTGLLRTCAMEMVSPHDCDGGMCPLGAFGVRAIFVRDSA